MQKKIPNTTIGTPFSPCSTKALLCGSGELGKELAIELKRYGLEVIALDRYNHAPAMQIADTSYTLSMLDDEALQEIIYREKPDFIIPEIEAIATDTLIKLEKEGFNVIPTAKATKLTMNRKGIRELVSQKLDIHTSNFEFANSEEEYSKMVKKIGLPCVVKPIMSSSGKGQSIVREEKDIKKAWLISQESGRSGRGEVIIEELIDFNYEITLLTIRHINGTSFCPPIGHRQENGDYQESWQPCQMSEIALNKCKDIAKTVTEELGGWGIFGVEFFIQKDIVYFSEISPRPHDTGMVTMISQNLSEFALHARAILGLPIPNIECITPCASKAILSHGHSNQIEYSNLFSALVPEDTEIRIFAKPEIKGKRRLGVALAKANNIEQAKNKVKNMVNAIRITLN